MALELKDKESVNTLSKVDFPAPDVQNNINMTAKETHDRNSQKTTHRMAQEWQ
jgi:hypothetical protein